MFKKDSDALHAKERTRYCNLRRNTISTRRGRLRPQSGEWVEGGEGGGLVEWTRIRGNIYRRVFIVASANNSLAADFPPLACGPLISRSLTALDGSGWEQLMSRLGSARNTKKRTVGYPQGGGRRSATLPQVVPHSSVRGPQSG